MLAHIGTWELRALSAKFVQHREFDKAEKYLNELVTREPESTDAHTGLGWVTLRLGLFDRAETHFRRAAHLAPRSSGAFCLLASFLAISGRFSESVPVYESALSLDPANTLAARGRARALAATGQLEVAVTAQSACRDLGIRSLPGSDAIAEWPSGLKRRRGISCSVTVIAGQQFAESPGVRVYLKSLAHNFQGDRFIFTHGVAGYTTDLMRQGGYSIIPVRQLSRITYDRWLLLYHFLSTAQYEHILVTDSRDVVFQRDVSAFVPEPGTLLLISEGVRFEELPWNIDQQCGLQSSLGLRADYTDWEVLNAGVQYGSAQVMRELASLMYLGLVVGNPDCSDQAMLNFVAHSLLTNREAYRILRPQSSPLCLTGSRHRSLDRDRPQVTWHAGQVCDSDRRPYAIVHQWDRTPFERQIIQHHLGRGS